MGRSGVHACYLGSGLLVAAGWCWCLYHLVFPLQPHFTVCIIKNITGFPCPSCGTTRSVISILHGHLLEGLWLNPIGFIAFIGLVTIPLWLVYDWAARKTSFHTMFLMLEAYLKRKPMLLYLFFLLITFNWIWNLYKYL